MANKPLTLADIPYDKAHIAQQVAFVRLQLFVIGEVHRLLLDVASASREPLKGLPRGEPISFATATLVLTAAQKAWDRLLLLVQSRSILKLTTDSPFQISCFE